MRPVICLQRCGLSALMGGKTEATTADVLYYFMMNAPTAYKRLMRAAKEAGTHGGDALATAELHLEAYGRQFDARANSGINAVTGIVEKADCPIEGLVYNFPPYKEDKKGKIHPVRGNGWGGARRGKAFESVRGQDVAQSTGAETEGVAPSLQPHCTIVSTESSQEHAVLHAAGVPDQAQRNTHQDGPLKDTPVPVPRGWPRAPAVKYMSPYM
ncbi:unnamed protein product, partial [Closterium sp. NIES-53]